MARRTLLESPATGFFYPLVEAGEFVHAGQVVGCVTDLFGKKVAELSAPAAGVLLYLNATLLITKAQACAA